jgi:cytochrome c553
MLPAVKGMDLISNCCFRVRNNRKENIMGVNYLSRFLNPLLLMLIMISTSSYVCAENEKIPMTVSINALMVTLIDHSAHYIWDYGNLKDERALTDQEWKIVEYYAVQLAAAGPLLTLGGSGKMDDAWSANPKWITLAKDLNLAANAALESARNKDHAALLDAGNNLVDTCVACHDAFKPTIPTEGILHDPQYDHLYHLLSPQKE